MQSGFEKAHFGAEWWLGSWKGMEVGEETPQETGLEKEPWKYNTLCFKCVKVPMVPGLE